MFKHCKTRPEVDHAMRLTILRMSYDWMNKVSGVFVDAAPVWTV